MPTIDTIFYIVILIMSVVVHEVAHGFMAEYFGDDTARNEGRLTLNPLKHLDMFGSILLPLILVVIKAPFLFGWAKPVPYNPNNLRDLKWGTIWVAAAGVLSNFLIATVFGLFIRFSVSYNFSQNFYEAFSFIVIVNLALAIFNLIPIPPLDGSKILFSFLPRSMHGIISTYEKYSFIFLILFIVYFSHTLFPILQFLFHSLTGLAF